jgi:hypothetical protein
MNYIKSRGSTHNDAIKHSSAEISHQSIDNELLPRTEATRQTGAPPILQGEIIGEFAKDKDGKWYHTKDANGPYEYRENKDGFCWRAGEGEEWVNKEGERDAK